MRMTPKEFITSLEQKTRIYPHCTSAMREVVDAMRAGEIEFTSNIPSQKLEAKPEVVKASKLVHKAKSEG